MGPTAAVISAVAAVGGTVLQYNAQKSASEAAQRQQQISTARERRQAIREAQLRRAQAIAAGANMGGLGGSSLSGGISALGSQLGSGLGYSNQMSALSSQINTYNTRAALGGVIAGAGGAVFRGAGGFESFGTFFKAPTTAASATSRTSSGPSFEYTGRS